MESAAPFAAGPSTIPPYCLPDSGWSQPYEMEVDQLSIDPLLMREDPHAHPLQARFPPAYQAQPTLLHGLPDKSSLLADDRQPLAPGELTGSSSSFRPFVQHEPQHDASVSTLTLSACSVTPDVPSPMSSIPDSPEGLSAGGFPIVSTFSLMCS